MSLFGQPFFRSENTRTEDSYTKGVQCLQSNDFYGADRFLKSAAERGHVSALYNLSLIHGSGHISPYDIDFAIACFRQAASGGHPRTEDFTEWLDKAEDTSFGTIGLAMFAAKFPVTNVPNHILMMVGCRLYSSLCAMYDTWDAVIEYELDAASHSDYAYVHNFIDRTGVKKSVYSGGLDRLEEGSPPDQITDGLNQLHIGLQQSGLNEKLCLMMRCTIVGYVISKSKYAGTAHPLLGVDKFFG